MATTQSQAIAQLTATSTPGSSGPGTKPPIHLGLLSRMDHHLDRSRRAVACNPERLGRIVEPEAVRYQGQRQIGSRRQHGDGFGELARSVVVPIEARRDQRDLLDR